MNLKDALKKIIAARKKLYLTQSDIAQRMGVSVRTVGRLERLSRDDGDVMFSVFASYITALGYKFILIEREHAARD